MALKPVRGKIESQELNDNFSYLDDRVSKIITTPAEGISEQEIIDARDGEISLGARLRNPNNGIKFPYFSDDTFDLDYLWETKTVIASAGVKNNPFGTGCEVIAFRGKTRDYEIGRVWVTQIAVSYGSYGVLGESKIRHVIGDETTNELVDKSAWKPLGIEKITNDMLSDDYVVKAYYRDDTFDLDDAIEQGNYMINKNVKNNPFKGGVALSVNIFEIKESSTLNRWVVQFATCYEGAYRGRYAFRLFLFSKSTKSIVYKSEWSDKRDEPLKILTIGNSFGLNATEYIAEICQSANVNVKVGCLYISGGVLSDHYNNITNNNNPYQFYKRYFVDGSLTKNTINNYSVDDGLSEEDWDYVFFNQSSAQSGVYSSFQPYLNDIIAYVKNKNPDIKIALMPTWAYASDFDDVRFDKYNRNQLTMYSDIIDAYKQSMSDVDFDVIIPAGTAIQNARTDDYMMSKDRELTRDGYHLGDTGMYIAGLTFLKSFFKNAEVSWKPLTVSKRAAYFADVVVENALLNPCKVTEI